MRLKQAILATLIWTALMIGVGLLVVWYVTENPVRGLSAEERASRLGTGVGVVTAMGWAVLWLPWAYKVGQKRRGRRKR